MAGTKTFVYGDVPDDPEFAHFEGEMWSENPTNPPDRVAHDDIAHAAADRTVRTERSRLRNCRVPSRSQNCAARSAVSMWS